MKRTHASLIASRAYTFVLAMPLICGVCVFSTASGQDQDDADAEELERLSAEAATGTERPKGILPIPEYSGDFLERAYLSCDWGGMRTRLAEKGIQFGIEYYQYYQNIADGGVAGGGYWGGKANYQLHLDFDKMGVIPGGLLYARLDSRWGRGTLGKTGQLLPSNEAYLIPVDFNDLERETWGTLTALNYTQFFSPKFAMFGGILDNMDGDPNEFAGGRGDTQFMNYSMMFAAPTAIVPASTLGAGALFLLNEHVTIATQLSSATDTSFDSISQAWDKWGDGQIWATSIMTQYRVCDLPGGFNASYLQWFNANFTNISSIVGPLSSPEDKSWLVALSAWQYLCTEESSKGPLDPMNKIPDLQGWGLFGRLGFADKKTNPFSLTASIGLGGRGLFPGRDNDLMGIGYFYTETESGNLLTSIGLEDSAQGVEAYYNFAITPAMMLSIDAQWLQASVPNASDAWVLGSRLQLRF